MAKNMETGKFEPVVSEDEKFNGKYVDYIYSESEEEAITTSERTHFWDPTIIPTVQYQVYGLENAWFWDNEGQGYTFDQNTNSSIKIQVVSGSRINYTYYTVVDNEGTPELEEVSDPTEEQIDAAKGKINSSTDIPSDAQVDDIYYTEEEVDILTPSEAEEVAPYEFNKYGKEEIGKVIVVSITPAEALVNKFPGAIVTVNGKEHDLGYLANITSETTTEGNTTTTTYTVEGPKPIKLYVDKDYKISINWVWGSIVETFRIICNR
jgi:hypothetical protein